MFFGKARQFYSFLFVLAFALQVAAQNENLLALGVAKKSDAEIQKILAGRSEIELKEFCDALVKQSETPDLAKDFPNRVRVLQLAIETSQKISYGQGEMKALLNLGVAYFQNKQFPLALDYANRALDAAEKIGDRKFQAEILTMIASAYRNRAEYQKSLEYTTRALAICEEIDDNVAPALNGVGAINMFLGDYAAAETAHRRALDYAEKRKDRPGIFDSLFHLALVNRLRGNYTDALRLYQEARQLSDGMEKEQPFNFPSSSVRRHIGGTYFLQGNLRLALDYASQALALDERRSDLLGKAYSLQFFAIIRVAEKKYKDALAFAEQTVPMYEKLGDNEGLARTLALEGNIYLAIGENEKALEVLRRALLLREAGNSRDGMAIVRIAMAKVFLAQKKYADALDFAQKAAELVGETGNREQLWQAQSVVGQIYLAQNECDQTREALDAAIATIESLRGEIVGGASENSLFFAERVKPYQLLATMFAAQNDDAESFEYAERAKARVLLDSLRFGRGSHQTAMMTGAEKTEENHSARRYYLAQRANFQTPRDQNGRQGKARRFENEARSGANGARPFSNESLRRSSRIANQTRRGQTD